LGESWKQFTEPQVIEKGEEVVKDKVVLALLLGTVTPKIQTAPVL